MTHYKDNVRDQLFNLFEVLGVDEVLGVGAYTGLDVATATEMLWEMARLARGPIAESYAESDRNPPVFDVDTHAVMLPTTFKDSVRAMTDGGWDRIGLDEALGGIPMPSALRWALTEHVLGANPAVWVYGCGAAFANVVYNLGTAQQKQWAVLAAQRGWTATMVLTEPDAGSDVGAACATASPQPAKPKQRCPVIAAPA
jgi:alkylation response protein AidB-like acyl-CoA dehydrogenase